MASPWLMGERCPIMDEKAKGVFIGITNRSDRKELVNAMMECICYSLRMQVDYYTHDTGKVPAKVGAIGGGALSDHWMQMMADVLNLPVYRPRNCRHSGAIGTAAIVCVGMGLFKPDEIDRFVQIEDTFEPNPETAAIYGRLYETWKKIYPALKDIFTELN
jgi:xylulokinase